VRLDDFGRLFWNDVLELGWLGAPVTIFAALGVINSFNLIDGMDGLAGGIFLVAAAGMALLAGLAGQTQILQLLLLAMAAVPASCCSMHVPAGTRERDLHGRFRLDAARLPAGLVLHRAG
jgi:UDP-N-acetylmuramyl pentapeptide phosphotransferase/UDP-N-acetylglucosamine-1-phosphate transferase